jgi:adenylate kinase
MLKQMLIFFGPPGSGKGSLSQLCSRRLGWQQLSTGNLCRQHIVDQTEIGKTIDFAIKSGKLISDSLIISMVADWLRNNKKVYETIILDGFPRTVEQASALRALLAQPDFASMKLTLVKINVSDMAVRDRLTGRTICQNNKCQVVYSQHENSALCPAKAMICDACESPLVRRLDDNQATIGERLEQYHKHENALINFYNSVGEQIIEINGEKPLEVVYEQLLKYMGIQNS